MTVDTQRLSAQPLLPTQYAQRDDDRYDIFPAFPIEDGLIDVGYDTLATRLHEHSVIIIDGFGGVLWEELRSRLDTSLKALGITASWHSIDEALHPETKIDQMLAQFLGGDDPLFGTRYTGSLSDFFDNAKLASITRTLTRSSGTHILYGCGAALSGLDGLLVYIDIPKNEVQYRSRAGSITNLGARHSADPKAMYKRFYFVDWVALNDHRAKILPKIDLFIDGQNSDCPTFIAADDFRRALTSISHNWFRARPWFEPGSWGGQWIKRNIPSLPTNVPNYAWSFELILPENGMVLRSGDTLFEASLDFLMIQESKAVLGDCARRFGREFPIRFDLLDTVDGGNLSLQCHPPVDKIRREFGETFTQDETYYILNATPGAKVFLGFHENVDREEFRRALESSATAGSAIDVERFIQSFPASKHDLFLIPAGTVHCSGRNCLVLEISATPYIFTFKVYDWLRLDLDGKPRSLNIKRAFESFNFDMRGARVPEELLSKPRVIHESTGRRLVHLPTHERHFYDVHRLEFTHDFEVATDGSCHVLSLVEGQAIELQTANGMTRRFAYAETFVVPAAARSYRLVNCGTGPATVIKAFMKKGSRE